MGSEFDRRTQIFAYGLTADADFPFATPNELINAQTEELDGEDDANEEEADEPLPIDWQRTRIY